jgi:hypothetical protein
LTTFRKVLAAFVAALLCLAVAGSPALAADDPPAADPPSPKKFFTISDSRIDESSGLAKSARHEGIWWTVNDSGDTARIFAVNTEGDVEAVLTFDDEVRDIEAIAIDPDGTIYVADIGDNTATRDFISVYQLSEPDVLKNAEVRFRRYDFEYPDGPHNAETLLVHPQTRRLYLVTKTKADPAAFYAAPKDPSREGVNDLTRLAAAPPGITDGTFLPDGRRVVLRSYVDIAALSWSARPTVQARATVPLAVGESVAVGPTSSAVLVGSEGANSIVYQVRVPVRKASATASPSVKPAVVPTDARKNHNLRWIVVGAGVFALLVAFLTFPAGRRERDDALVEEQRLLEQRPPPRRPTY